MITYYMRTRWDDPHLPHPDLRGMSRCGLDLSVMVRVNDLQVLVYLSGRHCGTCTPNLGRVEPTHHFHPRRTAA